MKTLGTRIFLLIAFVVVMNGVCPLRVIAQEGLLPGEPDPNTSPRQEERLIDDRDECPHGTKRFQKMKCGSTEDNQECQNYSPVLECKKDPVKLHCKKPLVPVPVYKCE